VILARIWAGSGQDLMRKLSIHKEGRAAEMRRVGGLHRLCGVRWASTLVLASHDGRALDQGTLNAVTAAKQIGGDVTLLVSGAPQAVAQSAQTIAGVSKVVLCLLLVVCPRLLGLLGVLWLG
jgi:hypothetical protein